MNIEECPLNIRTIARYQDSIYENPKSRLGLIPVFILDTAIEILKFPVQAITCLALIALNLIGSLFCRDSDAEFSLKNAFSCTESMLDSIAATPVALIMLPSKLLYQIFTIAVNPEKAQSMSNLWRGSV